MAIKLSKRLIESLEPKAGEYVEWDTAVPGLGVRVRPSGRKTYIYRYRAKGSKRQRKLGLGNVSVVSLEDARLSAREYGTRVAKGDDPMAESEPTKTAPMTAALAERFLAEHVRIKRKPATYEQYELLLRRYILPVLGHVPFDQLTKSDLAKMHSANADHAVSANRALAVFGSLHSYAINIGAIEDLPSPARGIERFKERSRERFLSPDEMKRLDAALRKAETTGIAWQINAPSQTRKHVPKSRQSTLTDPGAVAALRLLILTGCRLREVLHLRWDHIDFHARFITLPESKTGKRTIFLNDPAIRLLQSQPRVSSFVFPGRDFGSPRRDLKRPWNAIRREAELEGVRIHDLRHTFASIAGMSGLSLPLIAELLGHADTRMTKKYTHFAADAVRNASERTGQAIQQYFEGPENG